MQNQALFSFFLTFLHSRFSRTGLLSNFYLVNDDPSNDNPVQGKFKNLFKYSGQLNIGEFYNLAGLNDSASNYAICVAHWGTDSILMRASNSIL